MSIHGRRTLDARAWDQRRTPGPAAIQAGVGCPLCGEAMAPALVACWPCYRASARLTPGVWPNPDLPGQTWTLTVAAVARCDALRAQRLTRRGGVA